MKKFLLLAIALAPVASNAQQVSGGSPPLTVVASSGAASVTGTVNETNLMSLKIPANSVGPNGAIIVQCFWTYTNSANTKTFIIRYNPTSGNTSGGVTGGSQTATTSGSTQGYLIIRNNNATNSQTAFSTTPAAPFGTAATSSATTLSVDTTADSFINVNAQLANTGETITAQHCLAEIFRSQ